MTTSDIVTLLVAIATFVLAGITGLLAYFTYRSVKDAGQGRLEQERQRKEVAFRAALFELADIITNFNHNLNQQMDVGKVWWKQPLQLPELNELMEAVWLEPRLWERITSRILVIIRDQEALLINLFSRDMRNKDQEREAYYILDLYLKQLIRYIYCEMRRQHLTVLEEFRNTKVFRPLAHVYGEIAMTSDWSDERSAKNAADHLEMQLIRPPLPEPGDPAFDECKLDILIKEAYQAWKAQENIQTSG